MKIFVFIVLLLSVSCAIRKTQIKRHADEAISLRQNILTIALSNTKLSENLTIPFLVIEYDTAGRITHETTGEIKRTKEETRVDSVVSRNSVNTEIKKNIREEIREKKSRSWQYIVIGSAATLFLFFAIYIISRRAK